MEKSSQATSPNLLYFTERGSGSPLLLVHGVMITGEMFEPIIDHYAKHYRVIVPDLRGHGHSQSFSPPYTTDQFATDLARLLDHLNIASAIVLGYSQGGAVAQQFVLNYPARCSRLILACTYAFNMATMREWLEGHSVAFLIRILGMKRFATLVISQGMKQVPKARAEWVMSLIASQNSQSMVAAWKAAMAFDSRQRLSEIKCPTLIVAGAKDDAVPMHHAKMLNNGIADSKLVVIEDADHALIWAHPDEFMRVVDPFLGMDYSS